MSGHDWGGLTPAAVHFVPLLLLRSDRFYRNFSRNRSVPA